MGRSRLGSSLQRVEDSFVHRSVLFYIRDEQMVCFTPAFSFFTFSGQMCPSWIYFWQSKRGEGPLMTPLTLGVVSVPQCWHSQMTAKVADTWNRSKYATITNRVLLKSQGPLLAAKSLLRKHSMRHSSPDAPWTLASRENILFRWSAVGGTPGSLVVLHVVAPDDEGELDFYVFSCYLQLSTWHLCAGRRYLKVTADYGAKHPGKSIRPFPFPATNTHTCHKSRST